MEDTILIDSIRVYPQATPNQAIEYLKDLRETGRREMLLLPDPADTTRYLGVVLEKYYTEELANSATARGVEPIDEFRAVIIPRGAIRSYTSVLIRKMTARPDYSADEFMGQGLGILDVPDSDEVQSFSVQDVRQQTAMEFLTTKTPLQIEEALNEQIIAQPELTKVVADFLYYHVLRQIHPELPQRPLMIFGPSGNGKTEVWRVAERLYGHLFPIKIIDGSAISCEGWSGNFKVSTYITDVITKGGILVVDEFDKLAKPKHNSKGDNVSLDVQGEFLKLLEGEYSIKKGQELTSKKMGFVLVGAFESLREEKVRQQADTPHIGFCSPRKELSKQTVDTFTDEDFIRYGIMPEIVGRIATKCGVAELGEKAYLQIIRNPNSRVAQIEKVLKSYGVQITDVLTEDALRKLIAISKSNRTGVRWVSAQVESQLLDAIREKGLQPTQASAS